MYKHNFSSGTDYEVLAITFSTRKAILKIIAAKRELHNDQLADKI